MDFSKLRESKNVEDVTMQSPFEGLLRFMLSPGGRQQNDENEFYIPSQDSVNYGRWLTRELSRLTPEEIEMMHKNGMQITDINFLKALKEGHSDVLDPDFKRLFHGRK